MSINYKIYIHRNKTNGKVYIGQTKQSLKHRWNNGKGYINCPYFYHAIEKYGWDNFEHEVLQECSSKDEADDLEIFYISKYKSHKPEFGYNLSLGGGGITGGIKYKNIYKYDLDGNFIQQYEDIFDIEFDDLSGIRECCRGKANYYYGFQWKTFYKAKIPPIAKTSSKPVYQYDLDGFLVASYINIDKAEEATKFSRSGISKCCNGHQKTFSGFQWSFIYYDKLPPISENIICRYNLCGEFIDSFKSLDEAENISGVNKTTIINCYMGRYDTAGSYIWKRFNIDEIPLVIKTVNKRGRKINLLTKDGQVEKTFYSATEAAKQLELKDPTSIIKVCKGIFRQYKGYVFSFVD